ncbi:MAG: SprB repeat-containing protein, partial [Bacteroidota bacterium]
AHRGGYRHYTHWSPNCPDNTQTVNVTQDCGAGFNVSLPAIVTQQEISQYCPDSLGSSECSGGNRPGVHRYTYQDTIVLTPACNNWTISYSSFARNAVTNIQGAVNTNGFYIETNLSTVTAPCNNTPTFTADPVPYFCVGQPITYNYGAVDVQADSLVFSFIRAREGSGGPSDTLTYNATFSFDDPINGIALNAATGEVTFTPTIQGNFVVVVRVDEFDPSTGNLLSTIERDVQYEVINCGASLPPTSPDSLQNFFGTGTGQQVDSVTVSVEVGDSVCFDLFFTDPNGDSLSITSNASTVLPTSTVTTFPNATGDTVRVEVCWEAQPGLPTNNVLSVFATDDACPLNLTNSAAINVIIPVATPLAVSVSTVDESCNGLCDGSAEAIATGGTPPYTYFWSPPGNIPNGQSTDSVFGLCAGGYTATVIDIEGEIAFTAFTITGSPPLILLPGPTINEVTCPDTCDGSITIQAFGGISPLSFNWSGGQ